MAEEAKLGEVEGFLSGKEWKKFVEHTWAGPSSVVVHTVVLPPGMEPDDPALKHAEVVEEKRYRLPAGVIPEVSKKPCNYFEAHVEPQIIPKEFPVPSHFLVLSSGLTTAGSPKQQPPQPKK